MLFNQPLREPSTLPPIDLQLGWPSPRLLPASDISHATAVALRTTSSAATALLYGPGLGNTSLRSSVAKWLSLFYLPEAGEVLPERICATGGASQNLANVLSVYTDSTYTRAIWMVEPTYFHACKIFEDGGFQGKLHGVPEDEQGLDIDFLERSLLEMEKRHRSLLGGREDRPEMKMGLLYPKIYKHVIYCVPTFSNPSAKTMSLERRKQLVVLARKFDALVISDDCYDFLRWPRDGTNTQLGPVPPRLVDIDRAVAGCTEYGNTVSNGTFSKLVGPGMRVGWAEGSKAFALGLSQVGATRSGGNPSQFSSSVIDQLIRNGALDTHIKNDLIPTYRSRSRCMFAAVRTHLVPLGVNISTGIPFEISKKDYLLREGISGEDLTTTPAIGGFFTYITFPDHLPPANIIAERALKEANLKIAFGQMFEVRGDEDSGRVKDRYFGHTARLCWAWEELPMIDEGLRRLAEVIRSFDSKA